MYTFNEFVITYNVNINFVEYYGIISAFPVSFFGGENHRPVASHRQTSSHNVISSTHRLSAIRTHSVSSDRH
jgi:hypothetical protein